jgi:hypothetical protein
MLAHGPPTFVNVRPPSLPSRTRGALSPSPKPVQPTGPTPPLPAAFFPPCPSCPPPRAAMVDVHSAATCPAPPCCAFHVPGRPLRPACEAERRRRPFWIGLLFWPVGCPSFHGRPLPRTIRDTPHRGGHTLRTGAWTRNGMDLRCFHAHTQGRPPFTPTPKDGPPPSPWPSSCLTRLLPPRQLLQRPARLHPPRHLPRPPPRRSPWLLPRLQGGPRGCAYILPPDAPFPPRPPRHCSRPCPSQPLRPLPWRPVRPSPWRLICPSLGGPLDLPRNLLHGGPRPRPKPSSSPTHSSYVCAHGGPYNIRLPPAASAAFLMAASPLRTAAFPPSAPEAKF